LKNTSTLINSVRMTMRGIMMRMIELHKRWLLQKWSMMRRRSLLGSH